MSDSKIPLAGVIGHPIAHSKSPRLHGHWLKTYGIAGHYVPLDISPEDFEAGVRMLPKMGFVGANVTIPHKETALRIADIVTDRAKTMGAANTLVFQEDGQIHADNTDGYGFIANLKQGAPKWQPESGPAFVFGAGGAARAIICSLLDEGVPELFLSNRTRERADALKQEFGDRVTVVDWGNAADALGTSSTVVNTTSLGMTGHREFNVSLDNLRKDAVVTDLVYAPLRTQFLDTAAAKGCDTVDGLGMLLHQAVPGFESWFGKRPEVNEDLRRAVLA